MAEKPDNTDQQAVWTIRTDKGKTFGPASLETLRSWASDGRIAPTCEASQDGETWTPVTSLPLDMDWIAEVSHATFYGPIHRNALEELARDGSLAPSAPRFQRVTADSPDPASLTAAAQDATAARDKAIARADALEQQLANSQRQLDQTTADLKARDHEFDAERQELKAAINRAQADTIKKEGRLSTLESENTRLTQALQEAKEAANRASEADHQLTLLHASIADLTTRNETLRHDLRQAEHSLSTLQTQLDKSRQELQQTHNRLKLRQEQFEQTRAQIRQLLVTLEQDDSPEIEDAEIISEPTIIPPVAPPAGKRAAASISLADIEKQAQRELREIGKNGNAVFARQPKK